ncbi:MAG: hypothetical protein AAF481_13160 [Acidobacteriota bacterium]
MNWRFLSIVAGLLLYSSAASGYQCGDGSRHTAVCPDSVDPCAGGGHLAEGPIYFRQEPSILTANLAEEVRLSGVLVVGDVPELTHFFEEDGLVTTWLRRRLVRTVCGRVVSVFDLSWSLERSRQQVEARTVGTDGPWIDWGKLAVPGGSDPFGVRLRFAASALMEAPEVPVVRVNHDLQFTRHLVNLRIPDFGASRIGTDDQSLLLHEVARRFFEHFKGKYTTLAVYPHEPHLARWGGFYQAVRNKVHGIGHTDGVFDCSSVYGECGGLDAMHFYPDSEGLSQKAVSHELAHHYGHYFDWTTIACIEPFSDPGWIHAPLWRGPATLVAFDLTGEHEVRPGDRTVRRNRAAPFRFHPLTLYGMGLLPENENPAVELAEDQSQLADGGNPEGRELEDAWVRRTLRDIVRVHGPRSGPTIPSPLGWATVVVSRDRLLDPDELKFWTYYARLRGKAEATSWLGYGSIEAATGGNVQVETAIEPLQGAPAAPWSFSRLSHLESGDWTRIELEQPLPLDWTHGVEPIVLTGRVTRPVSGGRSLVFSFYEGSDPNALVLEKRLQIDRNQRFQGRFAPSDLPPGRYLVNAFLCADGACEHSAGPSWTVLRVSPQPP